MKISYDLKDIDAVAVEVLKACQGNNCLAFFAEMGSGKTTLISAICRHLGVEDSVSSPTFSIINEYYSPGLNQTIYHMDWYRLRHAEDAIEAGVQDVLENKNTLSLIEWPEIAPEMLPREYAQINISIVNENTRLLEVKTSADRT
ncbi:MAG: tRNA (adenosine(37)-N6)-threonylcarbamoyltransferase complex ATPase subunit type 1 TsaE [Chitinophagaceae bacterium]|nr:tRNA (adenosine(37)-N6)-threonylcarbamoyltransferase complex ATPase subunit type 1 TsaE [Chitinophagaceae bacterium]